MKIELSVSKMLRKVGEYRSGLSIREATTVPSPERTENTDNAQYLYPHPMQQCIDPTQGERDFLLIQIIPIANAITHH